jgi:hypothetical protein
MTNATLGQFGLVFAVAFFAMSMGGILEGVDLTSPPFIGYMTKGCGI